MTTTLKKGLGRGMDTLIPSSVERKEPIISSNADNAEQAWDPLAAGIAKKPLGDNVTHIAADLLEAGPYQPRSLFDEERLEELTESIKRSGVIQPIIVAPMNDKGKHPIIAGERRWRASQRANLHAIPAIIKDVSSTEAMEIALVENVQRQDLTIIEEAEGYKRLIEEFGYTQEKLADILGKSRSHITNILRLLALPAEVKTLLNEGKISMGHARALLTADNPSEIASAIVAKGLNVRQVESLMRDKKQQDEAQTSPAPKTPMLDDNIEEQLQAHIAKSVKYKTDLSMKDTQRGKITVHFNNMQELDQIVSILATVNKKG